MKQAALGKSIPKSPNSWDDEQTPVLERGSAISSELCRVELGEAGEGVGLAPTSSSPRSHLQSAWSCGRCSDWGTWVLHAGSTAGDGGRSLYLTKAPSRVKTSCTPSVIKGPICPFSLTVLQTHGQQSPFSRRVLSAATAPTPTWLPPRHRAPWSSELGSFPLLEAPLGLGPAFGHLDTHHRTRRYCCSSLLFLTSMP